MFFILIAFLVAAFSGSSNPIFIRFATKEIPPITFSAMRFLLATIILFPFFIKQKERIAFKDLYKVLPYTANMSLYAIGIQFTSVTMSSILYTLAPIFSAYLGFILLKEKLLKMQIVGGFFAFLGTTILIYESIVKSDILSFGTPIGNLLIFIAVCSWGFYPIGARSLSKSYKNETILFYTFAITAILALLMVPFEWLVRPLNLSGISYVTYVSIAGSAIVGTSLYYFFYQWLIKNTSVFIASLILYVGVITASVYGAIFFGERVTTQFIFGAGFVLFGVFLATTYRHLKKK